MRNVQAWVTLACLGFAGCGGGSAPATTDDTASHEETSTGGEDTIPTADGWATMAAAEKREWMAHEVTPRMMAMFQEFDGERYADFSCRTCHGDGVTSDFAMPSNSLPALHATGTPEQQQMVTQYNPMIRFMFQRVLPNMQTLVGGQEYNEQTQEGFSCYSCHPHAGDEGSTPLSLDMPEAAADAAPEEAGDAG